MTLRTDHHRNHDDDEDLADANGDKPITMGTLMSWVFKLNMLALPVIGSGMLYLLVNTAKLIATDHTRIDHLEANVKQLREKTGLAQISAP